MRIVLTDHARARMGQRAIILQEIEHVLRHPEQVLEMRDFTSLAVGIVRNRKIRVKYARREKYICVITVM